MFVVVYEGTNGIETFGPFKSFNDASNWMKKDSSKQIEYLKQNDVYPDNIENNESSINIYTDSDYPEYQWHISKVIIPN